MIRRALFAFFGAVGCAALAAAFPVIPVSFPIMHGISLALVLEKGIAILGVSLAVYAVYTLVAGLVLRRTTDKRKRHTLARVVRFAFVVVGAIAALGVLTQQWMGVLVSLGVVGVALSLALQQPLLSLLGWIYIVTKHPYSVGDRVRIDDSRGDVIDVDYLVTTLWEVNGELVSTNQPSGRHITVPNSVVLSSHVVNFSRDEFPYVWNELPIQVAYETDLEFTRTLMRETAEEFLGDEMERNVARYRDLLAETPVELDVYDHPTVNVRQEESWVELRLRYLTSPRRGTRVRNELYDRLLERLNEHPERIKFPVSRNR